MEELIDTLDGLDIMPIGIHFWDWTYQGSVSLAKSVVRAIKETQSLISVGIASDHLLVVQRWIAPASYKR